MWFISGKLTWLPLYAVLLWLVIRKAGRNWWIALIGIGLTVALADSISVHCFKNVVMRYRPTHNLELEGILHIVNGYHGGWYGFVSSHAANTFGVATFICLVLRHKAAWIGLMVWAALVCYSRMYIGAHYPADIVCGGLLGALCGYAAYRLYQWLCNKRLSTIKTENQQDGRP